MQLSLLCGGSDFGKATLAHPKDIPDTSLPTMVDSGAEVGLLLYSEHYAQLDKAGVRVYPATGNVRCACGKLLLVFLEYTSGITNGKVE